ncbi:MAG: hypothetical protein ACFFCI_08865 [Promethearchaeota archaeon]
MKKIKPNALRRIWAGRNAGFTALLVMLAIGGYIATLFAFPMYVKLSGSLLIIVLSIAIAYIRGQMKHIPIEFTEELGNENNYVCQYCTKDKLREACEMTKSLFRDEYVAFDQVEQWRMKNSKAFVEILNSNGQLCACFGILAIEKSFMDQFEKGKVKDTQMHEDNILNFTNSKKSEALYISGVVVRNHSHYIGGKRARVMTWAMLKYLRKLYGFNPVKTLFALAVTKESELLLKNLEFELVMGGKMRVDKCNLYRYQLTKGNWEILENRVGNWSGLCKLKF